MSKYRGASRSTERLVTISVTIPTDLLHDADELVTDRKLADRSFNRSALIEVALRLHLEAIKTPRSRP